MMPCEHECMSHMVTIMQGFVSLVASLQMKNRKTTDRLGQQRSFT